MQISSCNECDLVCSCDKLGLKSNHDCQVTELQAMFFCVRHTYKKVAELFIKKKFWVFQIAQVESCGCPAGGAVFLTHPFDQLFLFRCQHFLSYMIFRQTEKNTDMQESDK